jgi:D-cysteine desulfhydrase family pyridoxal phosphate-dependent enzyme
MTGPLAAIGRFPRERLAVNLPTPLHPAPRLTEAINGPDIWIKRDDLIGFGFGGNKVRGLEFLLAEARAQGADTLITGAGVQSNHVRATAAAARRAGLDMIAVLWGTRPKACEGNYRMTRLLDAEIRFTESADRATVDSGIEAATAELRAAGRTPYAIPRAGAAPLGVLAHALAVRELSEQCETAGIRPGAVVLATGSSCTQAGWLLGARALGLPWRIEGITVSRPAADCCANIQQLATAAAALIGAAPALEDEAAIVHDGFIGDGYGAPSPEGAAAIRLAARTEGIFLDPTYTGKALAGLIALAREGRFAKGETVVFLHSGGEPVLFTGDADWLLGPETAG